MIRNCLRKTVSDGVRPVQVRCERHAGGLSVPDRSMIMQVMPRLIQRTIPASRATASPFARRHSSERTAAAAHELTGRQEDKERQQQQYQKQTADGAQASSRVEVS